MLGGMWLYVGAMGGTTWYLARYGLSLTNTWPGRQTAGPSPSDRKCVLHVTQILN